MWMQHNGSVGYLHNVTGSLYIRNEDSSGDIYIQGKSGEHSIICNYDGGVDLYYDGGVVAQTTANGFQITNGALDIINNGGSGASLRNYSAGVFFMGNAAQGDLALYCQDNTNNSIILQANTGEKYIECNMGGSVDLYHHGTKKLETQSSGAQVHGALRLIGQESAYRTGQAQPLIYRSGSTSGTYPFNNFGHLVIQTRTDGSNRDIIFATGTSSANQIVINSNGDMKIPDGKELQFGGPLDSGDGDLRIHHNGSHSYIQDVGTGNLYVESNHVNIDGGGTEMANFYQGGSVELFDTGTKRFNTTSTGISVTGEVAASQDYPNSRPTLDLNFAATKKLDPRITYTRTGSASFVNEFGKVVIVGGNVPRFDHDPITRERKGLLIEEGRTNLLKYSVDFASIGGYNANYSAARSTLTSTTELAPDGTNTASKYVRTAGQGTGEVAIIVNPIGTTSGTVYTTSVFVKNFGTNSVVELVNVRATSVHDDSQFNLANGTITTEGSDISLTTITPYPNDWYRISVTATANNNGYFWVRTYNQPEGSGFILWGGQVEAGSFPSSYIPTYDNASVARGADLVEITEEEFSEFYNRTEGSFVSEIMLPPSWPISGYGSYMMTLSDGSYNNRVTLASSTGSAQFNADINIGSNSPFRANLGSYTSGSHSIKAAIAYKISDSAGSLNGAAAVTSSPSGTLPLLTRADIGKDHANYNLLNGHVKRIMYYPKRLSNNQLRTLTS